MGEACGEVLIGESESESVTVEESGPEVLPILGLLGLGSISS